MSSGPLIFLFLWVSGREALEEIFSIILVPSGWVFFFLPQAESKFVHAGLSTPAEADQAESQSQRNELVRDF